VLLDRGAGHPGDGPGIRDGRDQLSERAADEERAFDERRHREVDGRPDLPQQRLAERADHEAVVAPALGLDGIARHPVEEAVVDERIAERCRCRKSAVRPRRQTLHVDLGIRADHILGVLHQTAPVDVEMIELVDRLVPQADGFHRLLLLDVVSGGAELPMVPQGRSAPRVPTNRE
jgi:hypothetical protein